jgi:hypothetical protein
MLFVAASQTHLRTIRTPLCFGTYNVQIDKTPPTNTNNGQFCFIAFHNFFHLSFNCFCFCDRTRRNTVIKILLAHKRVVDNFRPKIIPCWKRFLKEKQFRVAHLLSNVFQVHTTNFRTIHSFNCTQKMLDWEKWTWAHQATASAIKTHNRHFTDLFTKTTVGQTLDEKLRIEK